MKKVFYNCRLFDGISDGLQDKKAIFINDRRIEKIETAEQVDFGEYKPVNLNGLTLLPGFIDLHVHVTAPIMSEFKGKAALQAVERQRELNFKSCIRYGITTIRDMGAFPGSIQKWKQRINQGEAIGPRVYTPNSFITSQDGPPERVPHLPWPVSLMFGGQLAERVSTPQQVKRAALNNLKKGADFLKTEYAETSMFFKGNLVNLSDDCFAMLRQIALDNNVRVAIHHTDNAGFKKGLQFGFDCFEHCSLEKLELHDIDQFAAGKKAIVPTLRVNQSCFEIDEILEWLHGQGKSDYTPVCFTQINGNLDLHKQKPYPPDHNHVYLDIEKSKRGFETTLRNLERLKKAGALIGVGSDNFGCYLNLPGFYWKELLLLTQAGFSNLEALHAATIESAKILGAQKELGSIEAGKYADFVLIDGNPVEDITCTRNVRAVVKDGVSYVDGLRSDL
ncbi:MAG: amidohydrolase family protein [Syntrophomonas sp.]